MTLLARLRHAFDVLRGRPVGRVRSIRFDAVPGPSALSPTEHPARAASDPSPTTLGAAVRRFVRCGVLRPDDARDPEAVRDAGRILRERRTSQGGVQ